MINIYFRKTPVGYKLIPGDRHLVRFIKKMLNMGSVTGIEKVYINLCKGFDELNVPYTKNIPFTEIKPDDAVIVLGDELYNGKDLLADYVQPNKIIAGIGLLTHPSEWPDLFEAYPIAKYLQHCTWANNLYIKYYGKDRCEEWPAGVETQKWAPDKKTEKKFDVLVYNKIRWDHEHQYTVLRNPVLKKLDEMGLSYREIVYGKYIEKDYFQLLKECRSMVFLCEHETQGFACCEAMSMNVPVLAWDPGFCMDPNRFIWNDPVFETSSVPFFDESCGISFKDAADFNLKVGAFWEGVTQGVFNPRNYILDHLTLKKSAERMLEIIAEVYPAKS